MSNDTVIKKIYGLEILDSRGDPTVRAYVELNNGIASSADVPSGASTGSHEALELRDGGKRYLGKGVANAVKIINTQLHRALVGKNACDQRAIDRVLLGLDKTPQKKGIGANAMLGVSMAVAKAGARACGRSLVRHLRECFDLPSGSRFPTPLFNVVNGGAHSDAPLDVQEFWVVPIGVRTFRKQLQVGVEIYHHLKTVLVDQHFATAVGDEGGYAPHLSSPQHVFDLMTQAVCRAGLRLKRDVVFGMDVGASELWDRKRRQYQFKGLDLVASSESVIALYEQWIKDAPIGFLEDGLDEDDWNGWKRLTDRLGGRIAVIGDDLFVTNAKRLRRGIREGAANAIIIKPNQIGTVSETVETAKLAKAAKYKIILSHRSGETAETFIADLAIALQAEYVKFGAPARSERTEKYNRLLELETFEI